jgi:hypothetical protein
LEREPLGERTPSSVEREAFSRAWLQCCYFDDMRHRRPPKLADANYIGGVRIFFTMCTFLRSDTFTRRTVVDLVHDELLQLAVIYRMEIIAYCYMPDHLHMLLVERRLWEEGYFRAGLCHSPTEYPFVGSSKYPLSELCLAVQWRPNK